MTALRHDRIIPLSRLVDGPVQDIRDAVLYLHPTDASSSHRRLWLLTDAARPRVWIDEIAFNTVQDTGETGSQPHQMRWVDMGCQHIHRARFFQLYVGGLTREQADRSLLLISTRQDYSPQGKSPADVERDLWGLARTDTGSTTLTPDHVEVGYAGPFCMTFTASTRGLPKGARIRCAIPLAWSAPQSDNPDAPGYIAVTGGTAKARIATIDERSVETHEKADVFVELVDPLPAGGTVEVTYHTERTYIYPQQFNELERDTWYRKLPPLAVAVAIDEHHPPVTPEDGSGHSLEFVPGPVCLLHLFLPGRRRQGESLHLRGTWTDRYRNVMPSGDVPDDVTYYLEDTAGGRIALPPARVDGYRVRIVLPDDLAEGVYRAVAARSDQVIARSNPMEIMSVDDPRGNIYWGEIHGHTEMSDGAGRYDELYRHAREDGCLDFAAAADHACYFSDNQWQWMQDVTNRFNAPGEFATLVGYEWAGVGSHRNMYTSRDRLKLFRGMYPPTSQLYTVYDYFHGDDEVVGGPHAPMAHGTRWIHHDPTVERFVEIYSMWGASDDRSTALAPIKTPQQCSSVLETLSQGYRLGFTGGGDCHEGHVGFSSEDPDGQGTVPHTFAVNLRYRCGMTAAVMDHLDRRSLIGALRQRQTYATTGQRVLLDFSVSGYQMGRVGTARSAACSVTVHAVGTIEVIEFICDGQVVHTVTPGKCDAQAEWHELAPILTEHYYLVRVYLSGGEQAWSTPVWLAPPAAGATKGDRIG